MRVTLRVLAGPYTGREFTFDQHDTFLIGRADTAHLYLPEDKFFSRNHCLLEISPPRCFLRDLGSTNGTFVNRERVHTAYLKSGDRIQGGETILEVEVTVNQPSLQETAMPSGTGPEMTRPAIVVVECLNCGRREQAEATAPDERMTFLCEDCRAELRQQPQTVPGYDLVKV